ncbi:unnamed protein product, partial [Symbiodinium sp. KB8]
KEYDDKKGDALREAGRQQSTTSKGGAKTGTKPASTKTSPRTAGTGGEAVEASGHPSRSLDSAARKEGSEDPSGDRPQSSADRTGGEAEAEDRSTDEDAGDDSSSTSSTPPPENPISGTGQQRRLVRKLVRGIYERPWNTEDMIFNLTQRKLRRLSEAAGGDRLKALTPSRREEIADALFNQAYSAMMAVGIFSWGSHMQTLHEALQEQLKAPTETVLQILDNKPKKVDWDAREDQDVVTPPFLDEDDTTDMPWTDPKGTEGDKQPVTSDLIVEFDDGTGKHRVQTKWSQTCAISGHLRLRLPRCFATSQWLNCAREPGEGAGDKDKTLDQDELVKQVEFVEIELDADTRIRPATSMATDAGTDYGLKIKKKLEAPCAAIELTVKNAVLCDFTSDAVAGE